MKGIEIYTDGACEPNPGPGAWGAIITDFDSGEVREMDGFEAKSTNQRMELMAPIVALESCPKKRPITIYSDSQYVIKGITLWIDRWKRNGWRTSTKKQVANQELWERLDAAQKGRKRSLNWQWVRGHDGVEGNERADFLARRCLFREIRGDDKAFRAAVRGFSRHHDFDPSPYLDAPHGQ